MRPEHVAGNIGPNIHSDYFGPRAFIRGVEKLLDVEGISRGEFEAYKVAMRELLDSGKYSVANGMESAFDYLVDRLEADAGRFSGRYGVAETVYGVHLTMKEVREAVRAIRKGEKPAQWEQVQAAKKAAQRGQPYLWKGDSKLSHQTEMVLALRRGVKTRADRVECLTNKWLYARAGYYEPSGAAKFHKVDREMLRRIDAREDTQKSYQSAVQEMEALRGVVRRYHG